MKKHIRPLALLVFSILAAAPLAAQTPPAAPTPGLLAAGATTAELQRRLIPRDQWTPFPRAGDRAAWEKADRRLLDGYIKYAEQNIGFKWPALPATLSLEFVRTGNRSHYEHVSFQRRATLAALLVAELAEDKGRFMDQIINGVWAICEESWWGVSAHLRERDGLMDVDDPFVDLFAATTSELLAWTDYFLGEKLDAVSPKIRARIHAEIARRILQPVMLPKNHRKHGWMTGTNNWNPWICSNWLASALLMEKDEAARAAHVAKVVETLDYFLTPYPRDGGCDEGPGYWNVAGGSLYDSLVLLNSATNGAFADLYKNEKIQNMLRYIARVQISDKTRYAINFADAAPRISSEGTLVWRFGRDIGDAGMAGFGRATADWRGPGAWRAHYARIFHDLFSRAEMEATPPAAPLYGEVWFPDLQVVAARETGGSDAGFYFAAKGGHNAESHNHNDIGNFIVYYDGQPVLIDIGQGTYTAKTFSKQRYELWNNNSDHHNVPQINGVPQRAGAGHKAREARFDRGAATFSADLAGAYPKEAGVKNWRRSVTLQRGRGVIVRDETDLTKTGGVIERLMTCHPASVTGANEVTIRGKNGAGAETPFIIKFTGAEADIEIEKMKLDEESDNNIRRNWGDSIYRISFKIAAPGARDVYTIEVTRGN